MHVLVLWNKPAEVLGIASGPVNGAGKLIGYDVEVMVVRDVESNMVKSDIVNVGGEQDDDGDAESGNIYAGLPEPGLSVYILSVD